MDYKRVMDGGTLSLGLMSRVEIYNYYGGWRTAEALEYDPSGINHTVWLTAPYDWNNEKQTFFNLNLNAGWESQLMLRDNPLKYRVGLQYGHASHDKPFNDLYKHGVHDNWGTLTLAGSYDVTDLTTAGLTIKGEYLNNVREVILGGGVYVTEFNSQSGSELSFTVPSKMLDSPMKSATNLVAGLW